MSFIENTIAEQHFLKGELLLESKSILEVVEIEKRLWSVMVKDNGIIEVEIQNPNTKSQKSTCECKTFAKESSCEHIAAALLHLRKLDTERKEEIKKKKAESRKQAFNIRTILDEINEDQLKKYIRTYAQKDKNFSIMLKAAFARSIVLEDNKQKYKSILDSLIKPISTDQLKSTSSDLRLAMKIIDEFNSQIEDCISLSLYEEAFSIIEATLVKLHYVYAKYPVRKEEVANWISKFHAHIDLMYQEKLAPKFKLKMDDFMLELWQKSYHNYLVEALSLYQIADKHKRKEVKTVMLEGITSKNINTVKQSNKVVFTALLILNKVHKNITVADDIQLEAINYLMRSGNPKDAIEYMEFFLENRHVNRMMQHTLLSAYDSTNQSAKYITKAIEFYVTNGDIRFYRLLTEKHADKWSPVKSKIIKAIASGKTTSSFRATFYFNEKMVTELVSELEQEADLRHLMKYDIFLYKEDFVSLERIYHKALEKYLNTHVGSIANNFINEIVSHLSNAKAYKMEKSVKGFLNENFPHRSSFEIIS